MKRLHKALVESTKHWSVDLLVWLRASLWRAVNEYRRASEAQRKEGPGILEQLMDMLPTVKATMANRDL